MISGCADTHPSSVLHKGRSGGSPQEHQPSTMQGTVSLWHHLRVTRLSHRVCQWRWPLLSRAGRGWMSLPEHWAGQPRVPSPGRAPSGSPPFLGKRAAPEGTRHGPISAPRMRGGGAARWRSWRSECGVAGGVRGMRDPPPSAGCGGTGGTEMGQGCDQVVPLAGRGGGSRWCRRTCWRRGRRTWPSRPPRPSRRCSTSARYGGSQQSPGPQPQLDLWSRESQFLGDDPSGRAPQWGGARAPRVGTDHLRGSEGSLSPSASFPCVTEPCKEDRILQVIMPNQKYMEDCELFLLDQWWSGVCSHVWETAALLSCLCSTEVSLSETTFVL